MLAEGPQAHYLRTLAAGVYAPKGGPLKSMGVYQGRLFRFQVSGVYLARILKPES